jgi:hypothetical protein
MQICKEIVSNNVVHRWGFMLLVVSFIVNVVAIIAIIIGLIV